MRRRWWFVGLLLLTAIGLGVWLLSRSRSRAVIPEVALAGVESAVIAEVEQARSAVEAQPDAAAAWGQVGLVLFANDLYAEAIPWLERAEKIDPADVRWPYFRGMALLLERPEEGLEALRRAAAVAPRDPFVQLRLAEGLLAADLLDEAEPAFNEVLRQQPDNARAMLGRGQILLRRGDVITAIPLLEKAAEHPTAQKAALSSLAEAYQRQGRSDEAEPIRQRAVAAPPDPPWMDPKIMRISAHQVSRRGRLQRALGLLQSDRVDAAIAELRRILRDYPEDNESRLALVRAFIMVQDLTRAADEVAMVLEQNPKHPDAHVIAGGLALMRGEVQRAESAYRQALELRPSDAVAWFNVADCRLRQNDRPGAIQALEQALRYRPGFVAAHLKLAEVFLESSQLAKAQAHLDAAGRLEPGNPQLASLKARLPK